MATATAASTATSTAAPISIEHFVVHVHANGLCIITIGNSMNVLLEKLNNNCNNNGNDHGTSNNNNDGNYTKTQTQIQSLIQMQDIHFLVQVSKSQTVGKKRKQAKKMKRGDAVFHTTSRSSNSNSNINDNNNNDQDDNRDGNTYDHSNEQGTNDKNKNDGNTNARSSANGMVKPNDILAQIILTNGITINIPSCVCGTLLEVNTNLKEDLSLLVDDPLLDGYVAVILPNGSFPPLS